jgi:hypothetical protein
MRRGLGVGEREAIALAAELSADALLVDDRDARQQADKLGIPVLGTLRVPADAAEHGFGDLAVAFDRLRQTNSAPADTSFNGCSTAPYQNARNERQLRRDCARPGRFRGASRRSTRHDKGVLGRVNTSLATLAADAVLTHPVRAQ